MVRDAKINSKVKGATLGAIVGESVSVLNNEDITGPRPNRVEIPELSRKLIELHRSSDDSSSVGGEKLVDYVFAVSRHFIEPDDVISKTLHYLVSNNYDRTSFLKFLKTTLDRKDFRFLKGKLRSRGGMDRYINSDPHNIVFLNSLYHLIHNDDNTSFSLGIKSVYDSDNRSSRIGFLTGAMLGARLGIRGVERYLDNFGFIDEAGYFTDFGSMTIRKIIGVDEYTDILS